MVLVWIRSRKFVKNPQKLFLQMLRMAMGRRAKQRRQEPLWIAHTELPRTVAHPFYARLNRVLEERGFDDFVERHCARFYAERMGVPR